MEVQVVAPVAIEQGLGEAEIVPVGVWEEEEEGVGVGVGDGAGTGVGVGAGAGTGVGDGGGTVLVPFSMYISALQPSMPES